jgi:cell division protein FtsA
MGRLKNFFKTGKAKSKKDYLLALDIGTEFVKALIFKIDTSLFKDEEGKKGLIVGVGRQRQLPQQMQAGAVTDIDGVTLTCQQAIDEAAQMARVKPTKAVVGMAGEFIKGLTTNFVYQRSQPEEEIDLAELKNILQKIQWKTFDQMRSQLAWETCQPEVEIRLVNSLVNELRIDGYQVTNPLGFQGREIFLSIFNVYAPLVHLRALENITARLNLELLCLAAEPYALSKSSGFEPNVGGIFIDVGGGTTDIALVRQGRVEGIKSLALAGQVFTKRLSQTLGLGLTEAEAIKIKHGQQQLSRGVQRKIREILGRDIQIWSQGVELILEEFNQPSLIEKEQPKRAEFFPPLILLCGGGSLLPGIRNALKGESIQGKWLGKFPFSQRPKVRFIQSGQIADVVDQTGLLEGPESITPLALTSLALEIATTGERTLSSILRRIVRMMR